MFEITLKFNPMVPEELDEADRIIGGLHRMMGSTEPRRPLEASPALAAPYTAVAEQFTTALAGPQGTSAQSPLANLAADAGAGVDAEGLPWDERIHSGAKSKTAAGLWTRRRNVPDEHYQRIRAELVGTHQNGAMPAFGAAQAGVAESPAQVVPPPPVTQAPAVPVPPQPDQRVPPPINYQNGNPFVAVVARVSAGIKANLWTQDTISQLIASLGDPNVSKLPDFVVRHDLIPSFNMLLDSLEGA